VTRVRGVGYPATFRVVVERDDERVIERVFDTDP